ncbi:MAG TPA: MmgE/PrpD family protein [Chloroflexota bacterium]|nr:MmgE/PrpD family protein [Chloroflexota bacterium]
MGATESQFASFVRTFPTEKIPAEIMHLAKRCLMNYAGVALFGSRDPSVNVLLDLFEDQGGNRQATIIGKAVRVSLLDAALANGYSGHVEDYDDTHPTVIHPSSPIYPSALAVAERVTTSGNDLLAAYVLGVEVACRVGNLLVAHFRDGADFWHITNTCGVLGAAAAAGRLLKLTEQQLVWAFAVAGTQASGVREVFGSDCKPFHAGRAAQNGLLAALLVQRGFTGTDNIFTGPRGFLGAMAKGYDLAELTQDLGGHWELPANGLKPYACGAGNHAFIDAALALREKPGVRPETIASIHGSVRQFAPNLVRYQHPVSALDTKFSYFHAIAVALVDGAALPDQFNDAKAHDPVIHSVRDKITVSEDPALPRHAAVVTMTLSDGTTYTQRIDHPTGTAENPLSDAQVEEKFRGLARSVLPAERVDRAVEQLWTFERVGDVRDFLSMLALREGELVAPSR